MSKKHIKTILMLSIIAIFGSGPYAFAQWGMGPGYNYGRGPHHGPGWHHGGCGGPGYGYRSDFSDEDIQKIEEERTAFFNATEDIRADIHQKKLELRSELAKKDPDVAKAELLQKEISDLRAQLDQKRIEHIFRMKKINPEFGRGFRGRFGMMGPEGYGGGCPNYPDTVPGGGYGMGPGWGMGPGMMGRGYGMGPGWGMGPGMMGRGYGMGPEMMGPGYGMGPGKGRMPGSGRQGRGYSGQYPQGKQQLDEQDARRVVENYLKSTRNPNLELGELKDVGDAFEAQIVTKDKSLVDKLLVDKKSGWMRPAY